MPLASKTGTVRHRPSIASEGRDSRLSQFRDPVPEFRKYLEEELNEIWRAQSDQTKDEAVGKIKIKFVQITGPEPLTKQQFDNLVKDIWLAFSVVILTDAALKIPLSADAEHQPYIAMLNSMASLLFDFYGGPGASETSKSCVCHVLMFFSRSLDAGRWEVRYRVLQLITIFLKKISEAEIEFDFSCSDENMAETDQLRHQIVFRAFDIKDRVAALAMEAMGFFQYEKGSVHTSKAFSVLMTRMQEHVSSIVRCAALKAISVCAASAPAILRRVVDVNVDVRVAAYGVIGEYVAPKIVHFQLRSYLLLMGLNHKNHQVRTAAHTCLQKWLEQCNMDYPGLMGNVDVAPGNPLHATKQLDMRIFDSGQLYPFKGKAPKTNGNVEE